MKLKFLNVRIQNGKFLVFCTIPIQVLALIGFIYLGLLGESSGEFQNTDITGLSIFLSVFFLWTLAIPIVIYKKTMSIERKYLELLRSNNTRKYEELNEAELMEFSEYLLRKLKVKTNGDYIDSVGRTLHERGLIENESMLRDRNLYNGYGKKDRVAYCKINRKILYIDSSWPYWCNKVVPLSDIEDYKFLKIPFHKWLKLRYRCLGKRFSESATIYVDNREVWRELLESRNHKNG